MERIEAIFGKFYTDELRSTLIPQLVACAVIVAASLLAQKIGKRMIRRAFERAKRPKAGAANAAAPPPVNVRKIDTARTIVLGLYKYTVLVVTAFFILQTFHVNLASVLTLAGIGGLAVGIGAQSLVKDILTGAFVWFEDQYAVGDTIRVANLTGTVEDFNLRTTKIRGENGELHIIPNSEIRIVTNFTIPTPRRGSRS
ncbi:MAG: mechanosensitive ion channel family protein [Clostridiales bacterium]|jgi:small conductance mechanosensitive channel|nr:mechanosensitive ion channel family protein [Clostridiales bacterium]